MALFHSPLDPRSKIQIIIIYFTHLYIHDFTDIYTLPPPPFPLALNIILNSIDVQAHNRPNHISSPPVPTSYILFCVFQFYYVLLKYIFLYFRNILFHWLITLIIKSNKTKVLLLDIKRAYVHFMLVLANWLYHCMISLHNSFVIRHCQNMCSIDWDSFVITEVAFICVRIFPYVPSCHKTSLTCMYYMPIV